MLEEIQHLPKVGIVTNPTFGDKVRSRLESSNLRILGWIRQMITHWFATILARTRMFWDLTKANRYLKKKGKTHSIKDLLLYRGWFLFKDVWLVVSTRLKHISQIGNLPQIGVKIKKHLKPPPRCVFPFQEKHPPRSNLFGLNLVCTCLHAGPWFDLQPWKIAPSYMQVLLTR